MTRPQESSWFVLVYLHDIDDLDRLRSSDGLKWTKHGPDVLAAWVADMDLPPPVAVTEAIVARVRRGDLGYDFDLLDAVVPAWCRWVERRDGVALPEDEVRSFNSVLHTLELAIMARSEPGDGVVVLSPIYHPFREAIEQTGRRVIDVALGEGWQLDTDRLEAAIDESTRIVLVSQPHNPTGRVFTADEVRGLADVVERHGLLVVSDEVWADLTHEPNRHVPLVGADDRLAKHTVTISGVSKAFNLSGLRCAVAHVGPADLRDRLDALPRHLPGRPSVLSALATIAAWTECDDWLAATRVALTARRDQVAARLAAEAPEVGFVPPEATYLAWLDLRRTSLGDDPALTLLEHARVALSEGPRFGAQGRGHARLNFATTESVLDQVLDRVIGAIRSGTSPSGAMP